jgi:hypothetical protein
MINAPTTGGSHEATVSLYKPICFSCGNPTPVPTPTPIPATRVNIDFTMPPKVKYNAVFTVNAVQLSGPTVTNDKAWIWQFKSGNIGIAKCGRSITITPKSRGNYVVLLQLRDNEHNTIGDISKSTFIK